MKKFINIIKQCREIIECNTARISNPLNRMFLIIGFNRNTKDDAGQCYKNGKKWDYDYVREQVVASGNTEKELLTSAREYKRLCGLTMEEYIMEKISNDN